MKIDFYISSLSGGGAEKVLVTLAKAFALKGNQVNIISLEKRPQFYQVDESVTLHLLKNKKKGIGAFFEDMGNIRKFYKKSKADVSISFLSRCNLSLLLAALFKKGKIVVCDRNNPLREHGKLIFLLSNLLYLRADRVIVQTEQIKGFYKKFLQKKIRVIENPLDTKALSRQLLEVQSDERMQKEGTRDRTILSMGRLEAQKDFVTLIHAWKMLADKYPDWKVKIFGVGDRKEELLELIESLNLEKAVLLCGRTETPYLEMRKASIFVLSSFYEGFPNVLCEAMYGGNLCIASDCVSGPRELIESGVNDWLFQVEDKKTLAQFLEHCILHEVELQHVRVRAQETVKRLYLENNVVCWENMLREIV